MPLGDFFVLKTKTAKFFYPNRIRTVRDVVSIVHDITSLTTVFIKYYYLRHFFATWEADNTCRMAIDEDFVTKILSLVKNGTYPHLFYFHEFGEFIERLIQHLNAQLGHGDVCQGWILQKNVRRTSIFLDSIGLPTPNYAPSSKEYSLSENTTIARG